jgi:hypothetical protein
MSQRKRKKREVLNRERPKLISFDDYEAQFMKNWKSRKPDQRLFKREFSREAVEELVSTCWIFSSCGPGTPAGHNTKSSIVKDLTIWLKRTQTLRHKLWQDQTEIFEPGRKGIERFVHFFTNRPLALPPQEFLATVLDIAMATSTYFLKVATNYFSDMTESQRWLLWAAVVARIADDEGVRVSAASTNKTKRDSSFVAFVRELQSWLSERKRLRKTSESLAKGIQIARTKYGNVGSDELIMMFLIWQFGLGSRLPESSDWSRIASIAHETWPDGQIEIERPLK